MIQNPVKSWLDSKIPESILVIPVYQIRLQSLKLAEKNADFDQTFRNLFRQNSVKYGKYLKINKKCTKFQNVRTSSTFGRQMSEVQPLFQALIRVCVSCDS